jgi:hypothetical protein
MIRKNERSWSLEPAGTGKVRVRVREYLRNRSPVPERMSFQRPEKTTIHYQQQWQAVAEGQTGTGDNKLTYHQDIEGEMGRRGRRERQRGGMDAGGSREASRSPELRSKTAASSTGKCDCEASARVATAGETSEAVRD